jgi:hypothetical protein
MQKREMSNIISPKPIEEHGAVNSVGSHNFSMEYNDFLRQTGLNEKQIVLLRWISVTVGEYCP